MRRKSGRIVTFYSYKGGTGRTMALSNVAWILASNGYDVLLIDWDLEAPGLHRYFRPFLVDPELSRTPGLIDFLWEAARTNMTAAESDRGPGDDFPKLEDYVVGLDYDFGKRGSIGFVPAGRQDDNYAQRVNTFNWDNFYERLGGGWLLQAERERLRRSYDFILIDSRTGVSDTSGVCTVQLPDMLAVFFTLNRQSIDGAAAVAKSVTDQRGRKFRIFPVPTRIENAEDERRDRMLRYARSRFAPFLMHVQARRTAPDLAAQAKYWRAVETPYVPFYAYEEVPAAFKDEPGNREAMLAANESIAGWISDKTVNGMRPQKTVDRNAVVKSFEITQDEAARIDWELPPRPFAFLRDAFDELRWQLTRHFWQWTAAALSAAVVVLIVVSWRYQSAVTGALTTLEKMTSEGASPPAVDELKKIQQELKRSPR
jgi:MinD-like ATPase involved in chromosome partitioning or flagellar assembly